ncbi:insulin-like growth factor-binding protein 3 receptor [Alligator mississippiensis]|uniref:Insulin-like growth factor-binding protein 3 receptor n=1 Tax=Alligator mississippiensis TaxID=8496 RepID=A0A151MW92_ALLMI|nr:insulin-like growth factor-binding protein 3 receptor [Alligator mississippiensis]
MAGGPSPLRQCLVQRPPLVACALGLAALGLALAALGAHVQAHNVRDSEAQDWNALLAAVAELRFCPESGPAPPPTAGTAASASVSVQVSLRFDLPGGPRPNATRFAATVSARRLGLAEPPVPGRRRSRGCQPPTPPRSWSRQAAGVLDCWLLLGAPPGA